MILKMPVGVFETPEAAKAWKESCPNVYCPHVVEGSIIYGLYGFISEPFASRNDAIPLQDQRKRDAEEGLNYRWEYTIEKNCITKQYHVCGNKIDIFSRQWQIV